MSLPLFSHPQADPTPSTKQRHPKVWTSLHIPSTRAHHTTRPRPLQLGQGRRYIPPLTFAGVGLWHRQWDGVGRQLGRLGPWRRLPCSVQLWGTSICHRQSRQQGAASHHLPGLGHSQPHQALTGDLTDHPPCSFTREKTEARGTDTP